jgi:hypothetical protein
MPVTAEENIEMLSGHIFMRRLPIARSADEATILRHHSVLLA